MKRDIKIVLFLVLWFAYDLAIFMIFDIESLALKLFGFAGIVFLVCLFHDELE